jgi:hypothetical protein
LEAQEATPISPNSAQLRWLGNAAPAIDTGVSFGVPWPRGAVSKSQAFALTAADGSALPLQWWPLAYWPDGSIKWTGFATVAKGAGDFRLGPGSPAAPASQIKLTESADVIEIDTGKIRARIPKQARRCSIPSPSITAQSQAPRGWFVRSKAAPHLRAVSAK